MNATLSSFDLPVLVFSPKGDTILILQSVAKSTLWPPLPVQASSFVRLLGPLKAMKESCASVSAPSNDVENSFANSFVVFQPSGPTVPLASKTTETSTWLLHTRGLAISCSQGPLLHFLNWRRFPDLLLGHLPMPTAGNLTNLNLFMLPVPHALEHLLHRVHRPSLQSRSQACMLHAWVTVVSPQGSPSYLGWTVILRVFSCTPPPQRAEQPLQPLHSPKEQSTGQGCSLQLCVIVSGGHAMPPPVGAVMTCRLRT
mmetsp:Transcript_2315/g.4372  ORF Transcript_2315/g.4372 Transcript_2315/m.4372 type:complete len:256 (-) Transcript_2315:54-821(-)